jgi:hypothetical protein
VLNIRSELTEGLIELAPGSEASRLIEALRNACNRYLALTPDPQRGAALRPAYAQALQGLRETFRVILVYLSREGGIVGAGQLAAMIPTELSPDIPPAFLEGEWGKTMQVEMPPELRHVLGEPGSGEQTPSDLDE